MAALIRQEKERQAQQEDDDIDDFWKDEKDDDEYSGSAESEHERRDVFDSDFDEDESESISASRCVETLSRHRRDSCPLDEAVGCFFLDFEAVSTQASPTRSTTLWR